jgi:hypothetical protein
MGYSTYFEGSFYINDPLSAAQIAFLKEFAETRRMTRDTKKIEFIPDDKKNHKMLKLLKEVGMPVDYYGGIGFCGQEKDDSIIDYNESGIFPSLWNQWIPTEDGKKIIWDSGEKFYEYVKWIVFMVEHFFIPWGKTLNGTVEWQGENNDDRGLIIIYHNKVTTKTAKITFE